MRSPESIPAPTAPAPDFRRDLYHITKFDSRALKVLFLLADSWGCGFYRGMLPAMAINKYFSDEVNVVVSNFLSPEDADIGGQYPDWDIIVHQRQTVQDHIVLGQKCTANMKTVNVYEIDDDLLHLDLRSPCRLHYTHDKVSQMQHNMRSCDYISVTTPKLKELYTSTNPNIRVLPNGVDTGMYTKVRKTKVDYEKKDLVIGWTGTATHWSDLTIVTAAVKTILERHPNVKFLLGGWDDCPLFQDIPSARIIRIPWTSNMLTHADNIGLIDIGICPLTDSVFNQSKSNIKILELAAAGIPVVASDVPAYNTTIKHGVHGLLVPSVGASYKRWVAALETLIQHPELRQRYGRAVYDLVCAKFDIRLMAKRWVEFYKEIKSCQKS